MNSKIVFENFANTLRALPTDCFKKPTYSFKQKIHVSEYVCKICYREIAIFSKCLETFE